MYFGGGTIMSTISPRTRQEMVFYRGSLTSPRPGTALNARPTANHSTARKRRYPPTQRSSLKYRKQMMTLIHFLSRYDYVYQTVSAISTTCFNLFYWSSSVTLLPSSVLANPH